MESLRLAIFDLNNQYPNKGLGNIKQLIADFARENNLFIEVEVFDVRAENEVPELDFDLYISTGGPGSPLDDIGSEWEASYFSVLDALIAHNADGNNRLKKPLFLICHSFQLFCRQYEFGKISKRKSESFGIYPVQRLADTKREPFLKKLPNPFWIADFRKYQVLNLNEAKLAEWGGQLLCLEKERPHIDLPPALMAIRFSDWIFGTQFHPEAEAEGMLYWFKEEKKQAIIEEHGREKYEDMIAHLNDPDKIALTYETILPNFLRTSIRHIFSQRKTLQNA